MNFQFGILTFLTLSLTAFYSHAAEMRILARYTPHFISSKTDQNAATPSNQVKILSSATKLAEAEIYQDLIKKIDSLSSPETLWIVQGSIFSIASEDIDQLRNDQRIESIVILGRKARLISEHIDDFGSDPNKRYTYGLQKIKLPDLAKIHPELTGSGVVVGIIDTGIDARHPDLVNKTKIFRDFTNPQNKNALDDHGHGTHVAGTIAGGDDSGRRIGVAPETQLIIAKSFTRSGSSKDEDLLKSLQWMADPDGNPNTNDFPLVISNSWNIDDSAFNNINPEDEVFCRAIDTLISIGITPVFAAGNDGSSASTIKLPAACPGALSVGATDEKDRLTDFSSRGPVKWKSVTLIKPEVAAPGKSIDSAETGGGYRTRSGTSMAAPHVSGALALLLQFQPTLDPVNLKRVLFSGASDLGSPGQDNLFGFGRIDLVQSIHLLSANEEREPNIGKIIGDDDLVDVEVDAKNIPENLRPLVEAFGWTNYGCTVTHIGRGYAITAGHCFDAKPTLEFNKSCSFAKVDWGYRKGKKPSLTSDCESVVARQNDGQQIDFAILKMKSFPKEFAVLNLYQRIFPNQLTTILSHPEGRPLQWSQYCFISNQHHPKIPEGILEYACDTMGGSSGAVVISGDDGKVVGVHKGGFPEMNYGTHIIQAPLINILRDLGF